MRKQRGFTAPEIFVVFYILLALLGVIGWVRNIVEIAHSSFAHLTGMLVLRIVGIFVAPLGAILGFL